MRTGDILRERTSDGQALDHALQIVLRAEIMSLQEELYQRDAEIAVLRQQVVARSSPSNRLFTALTAIGRHLMLLPHGLSFRRQLAAVETSEFFDANWYAARHPECGGAPFAGIHYLRTGAFEGHDPGPDFVTAAYLRANPDVTAARIPALAHYLLYGRAEGRRLRPVRPVAGDGVTGS
jgi:hypothetical protein